MTTPHPNRRQRGGTTDRLGCCPTCGQRLAPVKAPAPRVPRDTAALSNAELYAYYKRTAPIEDLRSFARLARCSPELRLAVDALLAQPPRQRTDLYRELKRLQDRWRTERYWERVLVPAERLARRLAKAQRRQQRQREAA